MITFFAPPVMCAPALALLEYDVNAVRAPCDFGGVADCEHFDVIAFDHEVVTLDRDRLAEWAVRGVVARQMRIGFAVAEIVDRYDFDVGATRFVERAKNIATDAAVAVDTYFDCHVCFLS